MNQYIITFGFQDEDDYQIAKSKPIFAKDEDDACILLKDQFESMENIDCEIISAKLIKNNEKTKDKNS